MFAFLAPTFLPIRHLSRIATTHRPTRLLCTASLPKQATMPHADIKRIDAGKRFNQVVVHDGIVYLSGQVARGVGDAVYPQTQAILRKMDALLEEAGTDKSRLLTVNVYLSDITTSAEMNQAWDEWVDLENMPVRATVETALVDPVLLVEIMATAALPSPARILATDKAASAVGPYNQGIVVENGTVYVSGCIGLLPSGGGMADGGVEAQTEQALNNVKAILADAGATPNDIVKTSILLDDIADFGKVNKIYEAFFKGGRVPSRSCFAAKQLPKAALVEIEAIASLSRT